MLVLLVSCALVVVSCSPTTAYERALQPAESLTAVQQSVATATLRGDPAFDARLLHPSMRPLHVRLWQTLDLRENRRSVRSAARSDDVFRYGRSLGSHLLGVLTAFRVTGDLRLLDYVDEMTQLMRSKLADGWRGTNDGTDGTQDGYLNWVYRYSATPSYQGKDTRVIDEMQAHAVVAMFAYAFEANRHLASPAGVDYGERADFWKDYLVNHFEAKWRERNDVPHGFPFITRLQTTTYYAWTRWHYYMWMLTGDDGYGREAHAMADHLWAEIRVVKAETGDAYVWASGLIELGDDQRRLQPTNYASAVYGGIVDLHLEGFHNWARPDHMQAFARTFAEFVIDSDEPERVGLAPDIGGGTTRAGLPNDRSSVRRTVDWFATVSVALIAAWDTYDGALLRLVKTTESTHAGNRDTSRLIAGLLVAEWRSLRTAAARAH